MIAVLSLLLMALAVAAAQQQPGYCTRTPYDWQVLWCNNGSTRASYSLCGLDWCALLALEPDGMALPELRPWALGARQFVAAALNRQRLQWRTPDAVNASLLFLGDALDASCGALAQWRLSAALSDALVQLYAFNHDSATVCAPENGTTALPVDTFYYTRAPDVVVLRRGSGANVTGQQLSTLNAAYSTNVTLLAACVVLLLLCVAMGLKLVADRSANRHFVWCRQNGALDDDEEQDHAQMLQMMEQHDGDLSSSDDDDGGLDGRKDKKD